MRTGKATRTGTFFKVFFPVLGYWAKQEVQQGTFSNTAFPAGRPFSIQSHDGEFLGRVNLPLTRAAQPPLLLWALCTLRDWNSRPGRFPCTTSALVSVPGTSFTALISGSPTLSGLGVPPSPTLSQYSDFLGDGDFKTLQNSHRSSPKNPKRRLESSSLPGHHICLMGYQAAAPGQSWQQPRGLQLHRGLRPYRCSRCAHWPGGHPQS